MAEKTVDVKVRASVELNELRKMEDAIQREIVKLKHMGAELDKITAKEKELAGVRARIGAMPLPKRAGATLADAANNIPGVGPIFQAINGSMLGIAALGYGVTKAFSLAGQSIRAFAASEVEMAKLDAALANSGQLTDAYREKLSKLASARSGKTGIDDEKYVGALTTLTKFGADQGNIQKYLAAVENLAGFMGGDLEQAAFIFGKAMQGSTEMLGRYGITVDKAKSQSEQLADIMRQLEARGGGQLEAMADGVQGSINKMANAWENMLESLGSLAEKSGLAKFLNWSAEKIQVAADFYGGGQGSKSKNREVLVGDTPEQQAAADDIAIQRKNNEGYRKNFEAALADAEAQLSRTEVSAGGFAAGMAGVRVIEPPEVVESRNKRRAELQARIAEMRANIAAADNNLAALDAREKDLALRRVTPAEADKMAEIRALREGTVEFGPGGNPEDREKAKEAAKNAADKEASLSAKREELQLELEIAEARARGDKDAEARLKWQKDYNRMLEDGKAAGMTAEEAAGFATRGANAAAGPDTKATQPGVTVLAGAQTQTLARLAGMAMENAKEKGIDAVAKNTATMLRKFDDLIGAVKETEKGVFTA